MTRIAVSRRNLLEAGACVLTGAVGLPGVASAHLWTEPSRPNEEIIRKYDAAWERKDWGPFDRLLADNFTFTSPNDDDHINKSAFKARCWETQIDFIERFELVRMIGNDNEAFVKYLCRTKNGKSFGTWSIFGSETRKWKPSSRISASNRASRLPRALGRGNTKCGRKVLWNAGCMVKALNVCFILLASFASFARSNADSNARRIKIVDGLERKWLEAQRENTPPAIIFWRINLWIWEAMAL